jgi:hypothetical protein
MVRILTLAATAVLATVLSFAPSYAREWERLGDRHVGFINDHDTIVVGRRDGKFKRLKLLVRGNDIELDSIKIVFGNGEVEDVRFHERIRAGGESPSIDLRTAWRDGRYIKEVLLHYHSRPDFRGEAVAELWGQED